ncbi:hypothetical protein Tco_1203928 [Tanacetum coccineum]
MNLLHLDSDDDVTSDDDDDDGHRDETMTFTDRRIHGIRCGVYFKLSDAQQEHALAVERLVPGLNALRIELCPFCMISLPTVTILLMQKHEYRATLTHELKNRPYALSNKETPRSNLYSKDLLDSAPLKVSAMEICTPTASTNTETVKHPIHSDEIPIVDKSVIQKEPHDTAQAERMRHLRIG